jgi:TolA-binding protein
MDAGAVWNGITAPQATILSAGVTALAAVVGVTLGWLLFAGRVKSLKEALDRSEALIQDHAGQVQAALTAHSTAIDAEIVRMNERLVHLSEDMQVNVTTVQTLRADFADAETQGEDEEQPAAEAHENRLDQLRSDWNAVRGRIEAIASDPAVDGRSRARYARIDRRQYWALVDELTKPQDLLHGQHDLFSEAVELWHRYRNGRNEPTPQDAARMSELRSVLVPPDQPAP